MKQRRGLEVPRVPGVNSLQAEHIATQILQAFDPDALSRLAPFPVERWYEYHLPKHYGLRTGVDDLPVGVEGCTDADGVIRLAGDVYEDLYKSKPRPRFTAVHEGVHGIQHLKTVRQLRCQIVRGEPLSLFRRQEIPPWEDPEWQASRIASAILMPWPALKKVLAKYGDNAAVAASAIFKVSNSAVDVRLGQLRRMRWVR